MCIITSVVIVICCLKQNYRTNLLKNRNVTTFFGMNIVRITTKNVVYIILAILLSTVKEGYMGYGGK